MKGSLSEGERWFVVHCLPHRESGAKYQLENQSYRTFLPCRLKTRRHARRLETIQAPLFPRYLFVVLNLNRDRWRSVNGTYGVASLVMDGKRPKPVPDGVVEALIAVSDGSGLVKFEEADGLNVGSRAKVMSGPFADKIGLLDRMDENGRVRLLLDIMGGEVPVDVARANLLPAAE